MSGVSQVDAASTANAAQAAEATVGKKSKFYGKSIGEPQLSDKAAKYYDSLKEKYSNMDFILVSKDQKESAQAQAASYGNANKMVVLIDEEKIEKMAEDEEYRKKYEGIIRNAATGLNKIAEQLKASGANIKSYGMQVNDNGASSFFATVDKSFSDQRKRAEARLADKKEAKKAEAKKAAKEAQRERYEKRKTDKASGTDKASEKGKVPGKDEELVTVTASSVEELVDKVKDVVYEGMSDHMWTKEEQMMGQNIDFRM